jgi:hypothetical protein
MSKLNNETETFLKQALSGLVVKEDGFIDSWLAICNLLGQAKRVDGSRMFHWVTLKIATIVVCPVDGGDSVEVGRFNRVGGDASVAASRHFELYA